MSQVLQSGAASISGVAPEVRHVGCDIRYSSQGLMTGTSSPSKGLVFRVAIVARWASARPAISVSRRSAVQSGVLPVGSELRSRRRGHRIDVEDAIGEVVGQDALKSPLESASSATLCRRPWERRAGLDVTIFRRCATSKGLRAGTTMSSSPRWKATGSSCGWDRSVTSRCHPPLRTCLQG